MENSACHDTQQPGHNREELVDEKVKEVWLREQEELKKQLVTEDVHYWSRHHMAARGEGDDDQLLKYVGGVVLVDGNGVLHPRYFGLACHLGVKQGIPTVGVAKNLFQIDGLERNEAHQAQIEDLQRAGDTFYLYGASGRTLGMALKTCEKATKPVYVSVGHQVSLDTAVWIATTCSLYRVPEPVRQADLRSREFVRDRFPGDD
ncbi:hypothetical protein NP493_23g07039 [Ridgeia piscesae]|uniref:Endonuclease V n=1 Tax=Ridgeia piscesae TaxID=27915 RepID=A0AAD9PDY7_RIDPI|nr:hypothetical protein NP493_23g07039 [Ridgeia piscesae]